MNNTSLKNDRKNFSTYEIILIIIMSLIVGFCIGRIFSKSSVVTKKEKISDEYLSELIKNYNFILDNYYDDIDRQKLIDSAISGMMESLDDPHSIYFDESETNNFNITLDGSYDGIGVQISKELDTGYMVILNIFKNSPAFDSGLKVGDKIISVENIESKNMSASEFSDLIKKNKKSELAMKILRDNKELDIKLKKDTITLDSVVSEIYKEENKKIGYIYIGIFANNTAEQFKSQLKKLEDEKIDSLIIDVRGNTGGHLTSVDEILKIFLNSKQVMYQFEKNKKITKTYGRGNSNKEYDIVLLCDETSASASEVLVAGLKENLGSTVIGKKTYGKGTVQELVTLPSGTQYKITVKKWLTPNGNWINSTKGILPDIEVDLEDKYYQTYEDSDDTQLQKAIEYLKNK